MNTGRLKAGDTFDNFTYNTPFETQKDFYKEVGEKTAAVFFLRYIGCRMCQVDMAHIKQKYSAFKDKGAEVFVIIQSDPAVVRETVNEGNFPYDIVCNTDMSLYQKYNLGVAENENVLSDKEDERTKRKYAEIQQKQLVHGKYEGEELQLPGVFLLDKNKKVTFAHYATHVADLPELEELLIKL